MVQAPVAPMGGAQRPLRLVETTDLVDELRARGAEVCMADHADLYRRLSRLLEAVERHPMARRLLHME
jgi:hypothetical protein